ncbi:MAG TPA: bifunctional diguanylate cyclase/phosphodiesterase, partial [Mobilitalea sp.]|nr:bifunctional diguanylate cyclase/phosphodiesterase [Mobilitalea sp.]
VFLKYMAECLKNEVTEPDFVARLGGDEFAILYNEESREEVEEQIEILRNRINRTWSIHNRQFYITMSVGIVAYPEHGVTTTALLKNSDIAMYAAKREGKNRNLFYKNDIQETNSWHVNMINNLQYGIDGEQFTLFYQPQFNLDTGEIIGLEALVRWVHPEDGFISPVEFIPLAEETGQIYRLERWIVAKALDQKQLLESKGYKDIVLSINISSKTLTSDVNFEELEQIFSMYDVDYSKVVIEITETANISDVDIVINHLEQLKKRGLNIALDDFGTGYSSLNYLKKFPIDIIKLDKSFIGAISDSGIDTLLIKNILALAHDLEFEVVAEGIETVEQLEYLKKHACESGQGFLLSKPLPEEKVHDLLNQSYKFIA